MPTDSEQEATAGADLRRALVVGGGAMGVGITEVLLRAGAQVHLVEPSTSRAARVLSDLAAKLDSESVARLSLEEGLGESLEVELAIEAIPEDLALKQSVLDSIERVVPNECLVASNTSSLSIHELSGALQRPERFLGMHFFSPVPRSALVEIVFGPQTHARTLRDARQWVRRLGKEFIEVRDSPGFATSRLGIAIGLEAVRMLEEGVASASDIDRGMELGYRFPVGPLRLTDLVGLDVRLAVAEYLASAIGPRFEPPLLLREMVERGHLGKKSGRGFYEW